VSGVSIKLDSRFKKQAKGVLEKYEFDIGIDDGTHYAGKKGKRGLHGTDVLSNYARGPIRLMDRTKPDGKISDVAEAFRKYLGINFWTSPFDKKNSDIIRFLDEFFKYAFGKSEKKRLINTLQAVVRNPILRGDYGHNSKLTQAIKGFDRLGIDTAQLFKSIVANVRRKSL
jgi:hypothetical protein